MSGLSNEQMKPDDEQSNLLPGLITLVTKLVEQNSVLIEQSNAKEQLILQLIEQNDAILNELVEQEGDAGSPFLDQG